MSLTVETGAGIAGADSYFAIATAEAYWTARPHDALGAAWLAETDVPKQEGAAREGTGYLDATWGSLFRGVRSTSAQGRLWPRLERTVLALSDCYPTPAALEAAQALTDKPLLGADGLELPGLPPEVVSAAIELSARALAGRLAPDKSEAVGWLKRRRTGPLEREWGGPGVPGGSYGMVDNILAPLLIGARNGSWNWR